MKRSKSNIVSLCAVIVFATVPFTGDCSENVRPLIAQKPAWLTDASLGLKETYDDNVFAYSVDPRYVTTPYTVPVGSVAALQNRSSWVTTMSPRVALNFSPLLGAPDTLPVLSLSYVPDFVVYHDQSSESYNAQRAVAAIKGRWDALSFSADDVFTYIDGSSTGPVFPDAYFNAYSITALRERREQIQDKANVTIQYDWQKFFIRPTAALIYYNMMTELYNVTGYQNYPNRYDINGGADVGYRVLPQLAFIIGCRDGHQYQQQFEFGPQISSSSDYQRVLAGLEGKPLSWLEVRILGGPDFRDYPGNAPVNDHHPIKPYGEAVVAATVTPKDMVSFRFKQWQWVSSIGKTPYLDSTYDLSYHRNLTANLGFDFGGKLLSSDYTSGNLATCRRNDWDYQLTAGLGYVINTHVNVSLGYTLELGRNAVDNLPNEQTREFNRDMGTIGAMFKF